MRRSLVPILAAALATAVAALSGAESLKILTYNLGLLRVVGTDYVPLVNARAKVAPAEIARIAREESIDIILLEEVWRASQERGIVAAVAPLGYAAVHPRVRSLVGLSSGLLLLVRSPLEVVEWSFTRFTHNAGIESVARKGVLEVTLRDPRAGSSRFVLIGTHTAALDTLGGEPIDKKQLAASIAQVDQILAALERRSEGGAVPSLLLGDFNVGPGYADVVYRKIADAAGLREAGASASPESAFATWDPANPLVKHGRYPNEPAAKIDHVFLRDGRLQGWTVLSARLVMQGAVRELGVVVLRGAAGVAPPLSDHYGFLVEVSLESR